MGTGSYNIIPEGENHCVWMDAGLVNYKLCDKNFDCDACPFDVIMKTQYHAFIERATMQSDTQEAHIKAHDSSEKIFNDVIHYLLSPLQKLSLPDDRLYFSNHTWLKRIDEGKCIIGIDGFLAHLLKPLMGTVMINTPVHIDKDSPFAWVIRYDDTLSLHAPIAGAGITVNTALTKKPTILSTDPYEEGWILQMDPRNDQNETTMKWYSSTTFKQKVNFEIQRIESMINSTVNKNRKEIGTSLFDGGMRIESIEQLIGEKRYIQLLSRLLRPQYR